ncbi:MAG: DoxX family protein, partial [Chitinophagaceae bacterium]
TIIIRFMVGFIFLSEGLQKLIFPALRGSGRFEKIGLPEAESLGFFVGGVEIACALFIIIGLYTRLAAIPLMIIMIVAIYVTKLPVFQNQGIWEGFHASRTDFAMLLGSLFLFIRGGGKWSLDR